MVRFSSSGLKQVSQLGQRDLAARVLYSPEIKRRPFFIFKLPQYLLGLVSLTGLFLISAGLALAEDPVAQRPTVPRHLIIPSINLNSEIEVVNSQVIEINGQKYRQWDTSENLVGWHNQSALLGQAGNVVLAGHSDINSMVFRDLSRVEPGQEIVIAAGNQAYRYIVTAIREVREQGVSLEQRIENGRLITQTDHERLTLITCSRPGSTHRIVVIARPATAAAVAALTPLSQVGEGRTDSPAYIASASIQAQSSLTLPTRPASRFALTPF